MRVSELRPEFVEYVPDELTAGILYISERFRTCSHLCCCGCGEEVVTPLSPAEWSITKNGPLVSLWPSIGNWDYECRSHYVIERNRVRWARPMTNAQIALVKRRDVADISRMIKTNNKKAAPLRGWRRLLRYLFR